MARYEVTLKIDGNVTHVWVQARSADHALGVAAEANPFASVLRARAA